MSGCENETYVGGNYLLSCKHKKYSKVAAYVG